MPLFGDLVLIFYRSFNIFICVRVSWNLIRSLANEFVDSAGMFTIKYLCTNFFLCILSCLWQNILINANSHLSPPLPHPSKIIVVGFINYFIWHIETCLFEFKKCLKICINNSFVLLWSERRWTCSKLIHYCTSCICFIIHGNLFSS